MEQLSNGQGTRVYAACGCVSCPKGVSFDILSLSIDLILGCSTAAIECPPARLNARLISAIQNSIQQVGCLQTGIWFKC